VPVSAGILRHSFPVTNCASPFPKLQSGAELVMMDTMMSLASTPLLVFKFPAQFAVESQFQFLAARHAGHGNHQDFLRSLDAQPGVFDDQVTFRMLVINLVAVALRNR
jgi:hypothetical protein